MLCAHLNENYKPLSCTKNCIGISVNTQVVNCGLNSLKLNMRRHEKRGTHRGKRNNIATITFHHIFLEGTWTFVGEVRGPILGHADVGVYNLSASPDVPPISRWASFRLNINGSGSSVIPFAKQHLWLSQCFSGRHPLPREISLCMSFTAKLPSLFLRNSVVL